jgi:hypothetical protein
MGGNHKHFLHSSSIYQSKKTCPGYCSSAPSYLIDPFFTCHREMYHQILLVHCQ